MSQPSPEPIANFEGLPWEHRLELVTQMMRDVSAVTNPNDMVRVYGKWVRSLQPVDRFIAISRRDVPQPWYRITRSGLWEEQGTAPNPWRERERLPLLDRGLLGELIYSSKPVIIDDISIADDDPAIDHLSGFRSLMAIPLFEDGVSVNMIVSLRRESGAFDRNQMPNRMWHANLFGRATKNLVLTQELTRAYEVVDRELNSVAEIQRSLLPTRLPEIPGLELAAHYQTSKQAGGDYYDFFPLDDGRLGILIADVSGHGTPAAVMMAVTHSIAHTRDAPPTPPCDLLNFVNRHLTQRYMNNGTFVTAFYGVYDPATRRLIYCSAGHNPPRVRRGCGTEIFSLDGNRNLPLGIMEDEIYVDAECQLQPGDTIVFYTDGITEARSRDDELFDTHRLDAIALECAEAHRSAQAMIDAINKAVNQFTDFAPAQDDRTLVIARIL